MSARSNATFGPFCKLYLDDEIYYYFVHWAESALLLVVRFSCNRLEISMAAVSDSTSSNRFFCHRCNVEIPRVLPVRIKMFPQTFQMCRFLVRFPIHFVVQEKREQGRVKI